MSQSNNGPQIGATVPTQALWTWSQPVSGVAQQVLSYPTVPGAPTKSGLVRADLENYIAVPIRGFSVPAYPFDDPTVNSWIRWAEDDIETETNIRLCQTWMAAPAAKSSAEVQLLNLGVQDQFQQLGVDYDVAEPGYDFFF